jgi:hypothetical protein
VEETIIEKVSTKLEDSVKNVFSQYLPVLVNNVNQNNIQQQQQQGTSFYSMEQNPPLSGRSHSKASSRVDSPPTKAKSGILNDSDESYGTDPAIRNSIYDRAGKSPSVTASVNGDTEYKEYESMTRELKYLYDNQPSEYEVNGDQSQRDRYYSRLHNTSLFKSPDAVPSIPISSITQDQSRGVATSIYSARNRSPKASARSNRSDATTGRQQFVDTTTVENRRGSVTITPTSPAERNESSIDYIDLASLEQRIVDQMTILSKEFRSEIDSVRLYARDLVDQNVRAVVSPKKLPVSDASYLKESSAALEHAKSEFDIKLSNSLRELEERMDLKISDIDFKVSRDVTCLHKLMDERSDQQTKVLGKMTDEQRWIEEEGIKLRVEHEAGVQKQVKVVKDELSDQMKYFEEKMKNRLVQFINQHEQNFLSVDKSATDALHKIIRVQEEVGVIDNRVEFLEDHMVGSRRRATRSPSQSQSIQGTAPSSRIGGSPPMKLQSSYYQNTSNVVNNNTMKSERSTQLLDSPPQLDNISISDSVRNLDLTEGEDIRLNLTYPNTFKRSARDDNHDLEVDESSLRDLQALLGRTKQRVARVTNSFVSGRASPPTSHFSYED